jgi:peptide/nickel transport system substrate-binding protein/oligopeptide transport system substrate-binding protein
MKPTATNLTRFLPVFLGLTLLATTGAASRRGGTLHLARPDDPQTLDPVLYQTADDYQLFPLLYLPLLDNTNGVDLVSCAAQDWNVSSNGCIYTFHLRPGIKFSNGRPVVAADYAYFLERMADPRTASPFFAYLAAFHIRGTADFKEHRTNHLAGVRAEGTQTLVVELDQPDPTFPYLYLVAQPPEAVDRPSAPFGVHPVGDGPYMVEEWIRGVRLVFKPNPFYAGPEPRHFDRIEIMIGGDEVTHLMMFERGELDIASIAGSYSVPEADQARIMRDPRWGSCVERIPLFSSAFVFLNTEMPPLTNRLVRQAINYAVDKTRRVASGRFTPAKGLIPPVMPAFNTNLIGYPFDRAKARQLLAESGIPLPIHLTMWYAPDQDSIMSAQEIHADLHEVGIDLELKQVTFSELSDAIDIRSNVQMSLCGWLTGMPDPKDMLGTQFDGRTLTNVPTFNSSFYSNQVVDQLLDEASSTVDPAHRIVLYQKTEEIIVGDAPCLFLKHNNVLALRQPWLKGPLLEPFWPIRLDRVWIER